MPVIARIADHSIDGCSTGFRVPFQSLEEVSADRCSRQHVPTRPIEQRRRIAEHVIVLHNFAWCTEADLAADDTGRGAHPRALRGRASPGWHGSHRRAGRFD